MSLYDDAQTYGRMMSSPRGRVYRLFGYRPVQVVTRRTPLSFTNGIADSYAEESHWEWVRRTPTGWKRKGGPRARR